MKEFDWDILRQAITVALKAIGYEDLKMEMMPLSTEEGWAEILLLVGTPYDVAFDGRHVFLNETLKGDTEWEEEVIHAWRIPCDYTDVALHVGATIASYFISLAQHAADIQQEG